MKQPEVLQYQLEHPNATMYRCSLDTGIAPNTVRKWWKRAETDKLRKGICAKTCIGGFLNGE